MSQPPSLPGVTHEWVDAGGLRTHVALAGPQDATPLLLVHGWPQHWWAWRFVIEELAAEYRIIAPDLRGHGWTDAPRDGYEKEQLASDLLALLDVMGIDRVTWAGHDWGAWTGMLAALRAPERFERLLPLCVPPPFSTSRDPRTLALVLGYLAAEAHQLTVRAKREDRSLAAAEGELAVANPVHVQHRRSLSVELLAPLA